MNRWLERLHDFPEQVVITGTDTGVGKTYISALFVKHFQATYWKPIQSGTQEPTDTQVVQRMTGLDNKHFLQETYLLKEPLSPNQSAQKEGITLEGQRLQKPPLDGKRYIIEGAGGVFVPLNDQELFIDIFQTWSLPVILVARSTLGTLNHTLLSLEALERRGINVYGIVLNGPKHEDNRQTLSRWTSVPILGEVFPQQAGL